MSGHRARVGDRVKDGYVCRVCFRRITADLLDRLVTDRVLDKLSTPRLVERIASARSDTDEAAALRDLDRVDARLQEIASMYGAGELDLAEYRRRRKPRRYGVPTLSAGWLHAEARGYCRMRSRLPRTSAPFGRSRAWRGAGS